MDKITILDFGGQYCHLISRRLRDFGIRTEVMSPNTSAKTLGEEKTIKGIILSGGERSVFEKNAPKVDKAILKLSVLILVIL